jgi:hypothetical protein
MTSAPDIGRPAQGTTWRVRHPLQRAARRVAALRDAGAITQEEFEAKKRELFSRI